MNGPARRDVVQQWLELGPALPGSAACCGQAETAFVGHTRFDVSRLRFPLPSPAGSILTIAVPRKVGQLRSST
jgi:hypothetical protein